VVSCKRSPRSRVFRFSVSVSFAFMVATIAGCSVDREAVSGGAIKNNKCRAGDNTPCSCASGGQGFRVCENGTYGPCSGCSYDSTAGVGGQAGDGLTGGQGGYAGTEGAGGSSGPGGAGEIDSGSTGGVSGAAGGAAVGGEGGLGGVVGDSGVPPGTTDTCPPPFICQTNPLLMGIFFCAETPGAYGAIPPLCSTDADCDMFGLPDATCVNSGMGVAACLLLCTP